MIFIYIPLNASVGIKLPLSLSFSLADTFYHIIYKNLKSIYFIMSAHIIKSAGNV